MKSIQDDVSGLRAAGAVIVVGAVGHERRYSMPLQASLDTTIRRAVYGPKRGQILSDPRHSESI